jgi:phenylalanine-4-hydroxylase
MGTMEYDITAYQPLLFRAESVQEVIDVVGGFFRECSDDSIAEMRLSVRTVTP